jgi:hypothetical protein
MMKRKAVRANGTLVPHPDGIRTVLGLVACALTGCTHYTADKAAVLAATLQWSCPKDRVSTVETPLPNTPPPDVAADPERLALWQKNRSDPGTAPHKYVVSGCGKRATADCTFDLDRGVYACGIVDSAP